MMMKKTMNLLHFHQKYQINLVCCHTRHFPNKKAEGCKKKKNKNKMLGIFKWMSSSVIDCSLLGLKLFFNNTIFNVCCILCFLLCFTLERTLCAFWLLKDFIKISIIDSILRQTDNSFQWHLNINTSFL